MTRICQYCGGIVRDDETVFYDGGSSKVWHIACHDSYLHRRELMKPQMNEMDPAAWAKASAAAGAKAVRWWKRDGEEVDRDGTPIGNPYPMIDYTITPRRFTLDIPVEALGALTADAQTRMLRLLSDWITENRPPRTRDEKVSNP